MDCSVKSQEKSNVTPWFMVKMILNWLDSVKPNKVFETIFDRVSPLINGRNKPTYLCYNILLEGTINPNLGVPSPIWWFSLNNSKTIKAVTLEFCSIQQHFIRNIRAKFGISNLPQSPYIGQNSDVGISNIWISGQSLNQKPMMILTWSSDQQLNLTREIKTTSKKLDNDVMLANCDVIAVFPIYSQIWISGA